MQQQKTRRSLLLSLPFLPLLKKKQSITKVKVYAKANRPLQGNWTLCPMEDRFLVYFDENGYFPKEGMNLEIMS